MIYADYGKTGLKVSKIGFGGMRFDLEKGMEYNSDLVQYAYENGINYFDNAPDYCEGKSESIFGHAFKNMKGEFYTSTKVMPERAPTAKETVDMIKRSADRMNIGKIDVMHIWCVRAMEQYEMAIRKGGTLDGIQKMKEEGLVRHIAISLHLSGKYIKEILSDERLEGILIGLNIFNYRYRLDGAIEANKKGLGVAVMNPLGGGFIGENAESLSYIALDGFTPVQYALRFAASLPEVSTVLNGFSEKKHIDDAVKAVEGLTGRENLIDRVASIDEINLEGACTACGYCDDCPQDIYIPAFMQVYNNKLVLKKSVKQLVRDLRFESSWGGANVKKGKAGECIACGNCEKACTQHLNIIERLKEMSDWK